MKKSVTITLRLTPEEERVLDRVARALRATRSGALRAALRGEGRRLERERDMSAHEHLKRYIPANAGPVRRTSLARGAGARFLDIVEEKHRGRRAR